MGVGHFASWRRNASDVRNGAWYNRMAGAAPNDVRAAVQKLQGTSQVQIGLVQRCDPPIIDYLRYIFVSIFFDLLSCTLRSIAGCRL